MPLWNPDYAAITTIVQAVTGALFLTGGAAYLQAGGVRGLRRYVVRCQRPEIAELDAKLRVVLSTASSSDEERVESFMDAVNLVHTTTNERTDIERGVRRSLVAFVVVVVLAVATSICRVAGADGELRRLLVVFAGAWFLAVLWLGGLLIAVLRFLREHGWIPEPTAPEASVSTSPLPDGTRAATRALPEPIAMVVDVADAAKAPGSPAKAKAPAEPSKVSDQNAPAKVEGDQAAARSSRKRAGRR